MIEKVYRNGFCIGCGTCVGVCPSDAYMEEDANGSLRPRIDPARCTGCSKCVDACPSVGIDFDELRPSQTGSCSNAFVGDHLQSYTGYSKDNDIRYNSSSGGAVTALLLDLLERKEISGAIVTAPKGRSPLRPEPMIAAKKEDILSAAGSRYCPVPVNSLIKTILGAEGTFACVGLPCHLAGLKKAELLFPNLREKIHVRLGLFCNHCPDLRATELLLNKMGMSKKEIVKLSYRGKGWPGKMSVEAGRGEVVIPHAWNTYFEPCFFTSKRCLICQDMLAELADISFGDAWLPEYRSDPLGTSLLICRTGKGKKALENAEAGNKITLKPIGQNEVKLSQKRHLWFRKTASRPLSLFFKGAPIFKDSRLDPLKNRRRTFFIPLLLLLNSLLSKSKITGFLLRLLPLSLIKRYSVRLSGMKLRRDLLTGRLKRPIKISIFGNYTSANRGDAAILTGLIQDLENEFRDPDITIFSYFPEAARSLHRKRTFRPLIRTDRCKKENAFALISCLVKSLPFKLWAILCNLGINLSWLFPGKKEALNALLRSDMVIGVGGGYLSDTHTIKVLGRLLDLYLARSLRKPVMLASHTIGPFNHRLYRALAKFVLDRLDIITLREPPSKKLLEEMRVTAPLFLTADTAFLIRSAGREKAQMALRNEGVPIGASPFISLACISRKVRWETSGGHAGTEAEYDRYLRTMAKYADHLAETYGAKILLFRMCTDLDGYHADDMPALLQVRASMKRKDAAFILKGEYSPEEIAGILGLMEMHVGTRMHSNILAAINLVPAVAIAYGFKFAGIMNALGLDEFVFDIRDLKLKELEAGARSIFDKREEIRANLRTRIPELKRQAHRNTELARDLFELS